MTKHRYLSVVCPAKYQAVGEQVLEMATRRGWACDYGPPPFIAESGSYASCHVLDLPEHVPADAAPLLVLRPEGPDRRPSRRTFGLLPPAAMWEQVLVIGAPSSDGLRAFPDDTWSSRLDMWTNEWLSLLEGAFHESDWQPGDPRLLIEDLVGWVTGLLTDNAILEQFLDEAHAAARKTAGLRVRVGELEKELAQARAQLEALAIEPKRTRLEPDTAVPTVRATGAVSRHAATVALTFVAAFAGALPPTVLATRDSTTSERVAQLETELQTVRDEVDARCGRIIYVIQNPETGTEKGQVPADGPVDGHSDSDGRAPDPGS